MNLQDLCNFLLRSAQLTFEGRLTRDPETRYLQSGKAVTKPNMAINAVGAKRDDDSQPDWLKVELWEGLATAMTDSARKGDIVRATGRLSVDRWTGNNGDEREDLTLKLVSAESTSTLVWLAPTAALRVKLPLTDMAVVYGGPEATE